VSQLKEALAKLESLFDVRRYEDVVATAKRAIGSDPDDPRLWQWLGNGHYQLKAHDDALAAFEKACGLDPEDAWTLRMRSLTLQALGRIEESADVAEQMLVRDPEAALSWVRVSRISRLSGRAERAWQAAEKARELAPESAEVWANLGWNASKEHAWPKAVEYLRRAIALSPEDAAMHAALGDALKWLDRRDEAAEHWRRAVVCDPRGSDVYGKLAQLLFEDGAENDAVAVLRRSIAAKPDTSGLRGTLIDKLLMYDRNDEALAEAKAFADALPGDAEAWVMLSRCQLRTGDLAAAEASCRHAVELSPKASYVRVVLADTLARRGRFEEELAEAQQATRLRGGDIGTWVAFSEAQRHNGAHADALATIDRLLRENPEVGYLWGHRARASAAAGDLARAKADTLELLRRRPKILRNWNLAVRLAWLLRDRAWLVELRAGVAALPPERARFGQRLLREAALQLDLADALLEGRVADAEACLARGLEDASRADEYGCTLACVHGHLALARGERDVLQAVLDGAPVGPRGTRRCHEPDCPDVARLHAET
jgi:tetratricopeptide (TPR) repeat protein